MSVMNVGIMGCGHIAQKMALTLNKTRGFRAYAAASRDIDKAVGFAKRNRVKHAYGSYAQLLQDKKVDLVYIATPNSEHAANARMCIEAGKPCLVEKPFAMNEAQAREVFASAEARNVFVTEAMWTRYMPFVRTMREVLTSGVIGDPVMLTANLGYPVKSRPRLTDPALGGGTLLDLGIYPINFASMLFGDDILRVEATCSYTPQRLDEQENITFIYRDGRTAALSASMLGAADRRGMVSGTKGYLVIENINNFEEMTVYNADHGKITTYRRVRQKTGYEYELQACKMALSNHWLECPEMTHAETQFMLHIMDDIREQLGIIYPCEVMPRFSAAVPSASATWQDESAAPAEEERKTPNGPTGQEVPKAPEEGSGEKPEENSDFPEFPGSSGEAVPETGARADEKNVLTDEEAAPPDGDRGCTPDAGAGNMPDEKQGHMPDSGSDHISEETVYVSASDISQERLASVENPAELQTPDFTDEASESGLS